jgi:hypothetical protein
VAGQELSLLDRVGAGAEVDIVGLQHNSRELAVGVGILTRHPAADEHAHALRVTGGEQAPRRSVERLGPGRDLQVAVRVTHERLGDPVGAGGVGEGPAALVAVPLLVDRRVVARHPPQDSAPTVVGTRRAATRTVLAHTRGGDEVEGT